MSASAPVKNYLEAIEKELVNEINEVSKTNESLAEYMKEALNNSNSVIESEFSSKRAMDAQHVMDYDSSNFPNWSQHMRQLKTLKNQNLASSRS